MSVSKIARKAGVSIATVSRVLNNSRPVNPEMAALVHRAVQDLQLPPRMLRRRARARARAGNVNVTAAIVSLGQTYRTWFELPVIASVVAEVTRAAQDVQMGVLITEMPDPRQLSPLLRRPEVEGAFVFIDSSLGSKDVSLLRDHLPIVRVMGGQIAPVDVDHIGPDNNAIGYLAGEYLMQRGLRELAYLTTNPTWDFCKLRGQGFIAAAQHAGISPTTFVTADPHTPLDLFGRNVVAAPDLPALVRQLTGRKGPLGLFVSRDEETVHVHRLLGEAGMRVGSEVVIVSCDNETVRLSTLHPRPASIDLAAAEIARQAVRRLSSRIQHRDEPPIRTLVNPRLVPGEGDVIE